MKDRKAQAESREEVHSPKSAFRRLFADYGERQRQEDHNKTKRSGKTVWIKAVFIAGNFRGVGRLTDGGAAKMLEAVGEAYGDGFVVDLNGETNWTVICFDVFFPQFTWQLLLLFSYPEEGEQGK